MADGNSLGIGAAIAGLMPKLDMEHVTSFDPVLPYSPSLTEASSIESYKISWHQLVVIGNGFDLECDLPSKFSDFIAYKHPEPRRHVGSWGGGFQQYKDENAWDIILLEDKALDNWCDIEGAISSWICGPTKKTAVTGRNLKPLIDCLNDPGRMVTNDFRVDYEVTRRLLCAYGRDKVWDEASVLDALRNELALLEKDFAAYLARAVDKNQSYQENARKLLIEILAGELPDKESHDEESSVLSFNYTNSFGMLRTDEHPIGVINIHGRLDGEIVFGIDGTGIMGDSLRAPFTKTYRLMNLDVPHTDSIVHMKSGGLMNDGTALIKFYGHSLGKADYSYFQALFDSVGLYEGNTRLIFYFRPPKNEDGTRSDEAEARRAMMDKAIRLLDAYGDTLDNKDHGKNLIHKLLMEGRLSVKRLPETVQRKTDSKRGDV